MIVYANQDYLIQWAKEKLQFDFGKCSALGVINDGMLICVVIYSNYIEYDKQPISIEMSIASIDKSWCTRHNLNLFFCYPFIQLRVERVQATVAKSNKLTRLFLKRLGFKFEGVGRKAWPKGGDATVYSLLKPECKWIQNGQRLTIGSSSTRSSGYVSGTNTIQ